MPRVDCLVKLKDSRFSTHGCKAAVKAGYDTCMLKYWEDVT